MTDEHPRVIPAPGVSGDLSPMNTPAQAELGRDTLGIGTMRRGWLLADAACDSPSPVLGIRRTVLPRLASKQADANLGHHFLPLTPVAVSLIASSRPILAGLR